MRLTVRAPLRIDFGGGWTDVPLYAEDEGGAVLNAAITLYVRGSIGPNRKRWFFQRPDASGGTTVEYSTTLPPGTGLGASAAQTVAWVTLVRAAVSNTATRSDIAEMACSVAANLGIVGGKQDEYASALGGIHYFSFGHEVQAERLELGEETLADLRSRLVLVYTGASRFSTAIHQKVWDRYRAGNREVRHALRTLRDLAGEMRGTLLTRDLDSFARLLSENWRAQTALDSAIATPDLDRVFSLASRHGALGGKACGAGGGGCAVFLTGTNQRTQLAQALQTYGLTTLDVDFDSFGVYLQKG